jgi:hypothetical protein
VTDLDLRLNMGWVLTNGPSADYLASAIAPPHWYGAMEAQLLIQAAASGLIGIDVAVNGLVVNAEVIGNLDGTPLL